MQVIYTANWVMPVTAPPLRDGAVLVDGELIADIGPVDEVRSRHPEARTVDLGRSILLPGLINVHSHLELTVFRGLLEIGHFQSWIRRLIEMKAEFLTARDLLVSSLAGCSEALRSGITTTADTSDAAGPLEAMIRSGMRGIVYQETFGPDPSQAAGAIEALRRKLDDHDERLEAVGSPSRLRVGVSPHAPYSVSAELYRKTVDLARERRLDMAIHTAESLDEQRLLADGGGAFGDSLRRRGIQFEPPGCSTIEYFDRLGVLEAAPLLIHCVRASGEDIELMARHGARVAHCPKSNAKFGHGTAPLDRFLNAGLKVGLGTDSAASNNGCDLIEEARFSSLIHRAARLDADLCPPDLMIRMMTIDAARALGLDQITGSLEPGKQADMTAVRCDRNPGDPAATLVFSSSGRDVAMTMVGGEIVFDGERILTLDQSLIDKDFDEVGRRLTGRSQGDHAVSY